MLLLELLRTTLLRHWRSQFDHDAVPALAFRMMRCPITICIHVKVLQLGSGRKWFVCKVPHHASCSSHCSTCCTGDFSHEVLDRVVHRPSPDPNTPTRLRNQDFCSSLTGSSPSRCRNSSTARLVTLIVPAWSRSHMWIACPA